MYVCVFGHTEHHTCHKASGCETDTQTVTQNKKSGPLGDPRFCLFVDMCARFDNVYY